MWPFKKKKVEVIAKPGEPIQLPLKGPTHDGRFETFADWLDWICNKYGVTYEIRRNATEVTVRIIKGDDVFSGKAESTVAAVERAIHKLEGKR